MPNLEVSGEPIDAKDIHLTARFTLEDFLLKAKHLTVNPNFWVGPDGDHGLRMEDVLEAEKDLPMIVPQTKPAGPAVLLAGSWVWSIREVLESVAQFHLFEQRRRITFICSGEKVRWSGGTMPIYRLGILAEGHDDSL